MDVRLSNILNSAEKLVREKSPNESGKTESGRAAPVVPQAGDKADFSNLLTGKFQTIQSKLTELQSSYTREQMRLSYLNEENAKTPEDLIRVLFGSKPLFPEFAGEEPVDLQALKKNSENNLNNLEREIRQKEVENENVVSLGVREGSQDFSQLLKGIDTLSWKPMNEKTVQKLIES